MIIRPREGFESCPFPFQIFPRIFRWNTVGIEKGVNLDSGFEPEHLLLQ